MATFVCPHNKEVDCSKRACGSCGWNPLVAKARLRKIVGGGVKMPNDKLFQIPFTGYCEVWAESPEEAAYMADRDEMFFVDYKFGEPICMEREVEDE